MTTGQPGDTHSQAGHEPLVNRYFRAAVKTKANDLHLKVGQPARLRLQGSLKSTTGEALTAQQLEEMVFEILSPDQKERFLQHGTLDFAYECDPDSRFRVNVFRQRGHVSLAARRVNSTVPSFEALHLPATLGKIAESPEGLVLVVGPTGCGKTTTIAAMLDYIARTRACHIVTIEDPIEYLYKDSKAIVSQREIGLDVPNYEEALTYPDAPGPGCGPGRRDAGRPDRHCRHARGRDRPLGVRHAALGQCPPGHPPHAGPVSTRRTGVGQAGPGGERQGRHQPGSGPLHQGRRGSRAGRGDHAGQFHGQEVDRRGTRGGPAERDPVLPREGMQDLTDNLCELVKNGTIDPKDAYRFAPNQDELKMALKGIRTVAEGIL